MKKILLSLISFVIGSLLVLFTFTQKDIILGIILIIFWFAILVPVLSLQYSKRILKDVKRVWLYVLWRSRVDTEAQKQGNRERMIRVRKDLKGERKGALSCVKN